MIRHTLYLLGEWLDDAAYNVASWVQGWSDRQVTWFCAIVGTIILVCAGLSL